MPSGVYKRIKKRGGWELSEKTKRKIGEARRGIKLSEATKKKMSDSKKGSLFTISHRKHLSEALKGRKGLKGSQNPNWKGGKKRGHYTDWEYNEWRKKVFERDEYTCQKTRIKGGKLEAHHIEDFSNNPDLRFNPENGITFQQKIHRFFHYLYGYKSSLDQVKEFLEKVDSQLEIKGIRKETW